MSIGKSVSKSDTIYTNGGRVMAILLLLILAVGALTAWYASYKGYNPLLWFFATGFIGLVALLLLPNANDPYHTPSERARLASNGNTVGGVIVGIAFLFGVMRGCSGF